MKFKQLSYKNGFIIESSETQAETLYREIIQILKPYGNIKDGFNKQFNQDDVDDLMIKNGWNYIDNETEDSIDTYKWEKNDYQCHIYVENNKITNFNIF